MRRGFGLKREDFPGCRHERAEGMKRDVITANYRHGLRHKRAEKLKRDVITANYRHGLRHERAERLNCDVKAALDYVTKGWKV